jgi:hypothetical protein
MALTGTGQILGFTAVDTPSANPTAAYPLDSLNPTMKTLTTIKYANMSVKIVDVTQGIPYSSVTGVPINPLVPPVPPQLPRPVVVPIVNTTVFMEGTLVTVDGDAVSGPGAIPDPRILHSASIYATIFIGTNIV